MNNRVIRNLTYELIYEKKNNIEYYNTHMQSSLDGMSLRDPDLMLDMRIGDPSKIQNIYKANNARNIDIVASEMKMKK